MEEYSSGGLCKSVYFGLENSSPPDPDFKNIEPFSKWNFWSILQDVLQCALSAVTYLHVSLC